MGKITKKYIGFDQVGSAQLELENSESLRAKAADGESSLDLLGLDEDDQLQILIQPFLPGDATSALQAVPKQQVDAGLALKANTTLSNLAANPAGRYLFYSDIIFVQSDDVLIRSRGDQAAQDSNLMLVGTGRITGGDFNSGALRLVSGDITGGAGVSGEVVLRSGNALDGSSGAVFVRSGESNSTTGEVRVMSGNCLDDSNSGEVFLMSGKSLEGFSGSVQVGTAGIGSQFYDNSANLNGTGALDLFTGPIDNFAGSNTDGSTGNIVLSSGYINVENSLGISGDVSIATGYMTGLGQTGSLNLSTGAITNPNAETNTGSVSIVTGQATLGPSGSINIETGQSDAVSGNIFMTTGFSYGVRGEIVLSSALVKVMSELSMESNKIIDLADPTDDQDAATKAYVDAQISAGTDFHKQAITLAAGDITNQYVDLSVEAIPQSCMIGVGERVMLWEGLDYTISVVDGVTRISFAGPSASAGAEALVEGQILYVQCVIESVPEEV